VVLDFQRANLFSYSKSHRLNLIAMSSWKSADFEICIAYKSLVWDSFASMNKILDSYSLPQQVGEISTYEDFLLFHVFQSLENGLCYVTWFIIKKCEYYKKFHDIGSVSCLLFTV